MEIVITGANRGIGLELARQCVTRGDSVIATARVPGEAKELAALKEGHPNLAIFTCDVADDESVRAFAKQLTAPVDVLINNAGVRGDSRGIEDLDLKQAIETFSVNALGPLRVTRALLPALREGALKKVLHVTSGLGSIGDNGSGGAYAYRMSKAALNMMARSMAVDLKGDGIHVAVINPGWVKTDMGGKGAPTEVADSAAGILAQLAKLDAKTSGSFLDYAGKVWPW